MNGKPKVRGSLEHLKIEIKQIYNSARLSPKVLSFKKACFILENGRSVIAIGEYVDAIWEIYQERARYLLNIDELLEEMHGKTKSEITDKMKVEFCWA